MTNSSLSINQLMESYGTESLHLEYCKPFDCYFIVALNETHKGPSIGGTRFMSYQSTNHAIEDCVRLAYSMYVKASIVDLPHGGGKGVITKPKKNFCRRELMEYYAEFVHGLSGRYVTAVDFGTSQHDMDIIQQKTPYVLCTTNQNNPARYTADGVTLAIKTLLDHHLSIRTDLSTIAIQGLGSVGSILAKDLISMGAKVYGCDVDPEKENHAKSMGVQIIDNDSIYDIDCDIFAPCAHGAILNSDTIPRLRASAICGAANNQLANNRIHAEQLFQRNILYCPDFLVNAGGLICASSEYLNKDDDNISLSIKKIAPKINQLFKLSHQTNTNTYTCIQHHLRT